MKNAFFLVAGLMVFGYACSKDNDNDPEPEPEPTAVELATANTWKINTLGYDTNDDGVIDIAIPLEPCAQDNTLSFNTDSTGTFSEGPTKCNSSQPDTKSITWYFKDNDQSVFIDGLGTDLDGDGKVLELTDSTFAVSAPVSSPVNGSLIVQLED
jgi:hypothetical protein